MSLSALALVLVSAATHAYWNFLLKRSGGSDFVIGLSKITEAAVLIPILIGSTTVTAASISKNWVWPVVGAGLVLANYLLLTRAYAAGHFSLMYPLSRGAMLAFLPAVAFVTIGERVSATGLAAVAVILAGIVIMYWPQSAPSTHSRRQETTLGIAYALLAALAASAYTVWDKQAVQTLTPVTYFAAYTVIVAVAYVVFLLRSTGRKRIVAMWRQHWTVVVQIAVFNSGSYLMALAALRTEPATYVIALRQLSIVFGAVFGVYLLKEAISRTRAAGIALIVGGCVLLAWLA